jgi:outer membrane receptor protein involved in Fe transport
MNNPKLSYAIAAILSGSGASLAQAATASDTADSSSDMIQEITVTAQRRTENIQDVPISIRALTGETLAQLNVQTLDDYIKYLPNVTTASNGPGQNEVYMRGLSAGSQASQGSGSTGLWPNVAIYLDNQSGQLPNRNLDIYAADLNRIEVLEGPQGTLFGAGAEAGAIRYITNEPKLDVTEGSVTAGYGITAGGDPNTNATAVLNLPLIDGTMAVRGVIYDDTRGGYIDNVPATFTRKNTDIGIYHAFLAPNANGQCPDHQPNTGNCVPPGSPSINNYNVAANDINPVTYQGIRVEALYKFNQDWNALLSQSYQNMNAQGVFYQQPNASDGAPLARQQVTLFNDAYDKDKFESTALTVNGRFGDLKAVYTGGYLVRNVDQVGDYTNYARGLYADYYQCYGPGTGGDKNLKPTCFSPSATWHSVEKNEHLQQEIRLSTPDDWRLRAIAGAYYEDNKLYDQTAWMYKSIPACTSNGPAGIDPGNTGCLSNIGTAPGATVQNPGVQGANTSFYQDQVRDTKQTAFFLSGDFDLIPKVLTVTAGTRHYLFQNSLNGSVSGSFGCFEKGVPAGGCLADNYNLNAGNLRDTESGFKSRANLTWHVTPDAMVYYTWSQGFRPGGFNQNGGTAHAPGPNGVDQYLLASAYVSDSLTNNEVGWKTEFFDHRLQWNGAVYREDWNNVQVPFFDPGVVGNIFYNTNGQDFRIKGIETSLEARVLNGLTLRGAAAWNQSKQTNSPQLLDNNPADNIPGGNFGKPITQACVVNSTPPPAVTSCSGVPNPYGPVGAPSADAPPIQFSLHGRYDWTFNGFAPFVQVGANHTGHSFTQAGANPTFALGGALTTSRGRFENPAYTTFDASLGVAKDAWVVTAYGENLSNSNASTFISADQFIVAQTPLRPRVLGVTFAYKF